jgi:hypothetical protein
MNAAPADLDAARAAVDALSLTGDASAFITYEVAVHLPFEALGPFKTLLKQFFSRDPWSADDAATLSDIVTAHIQGGWWEHDLDGLALAHGIRDGEYVIWVTGAAAATRPSLFDRVFSGPVIPEPTPHPRKVKFVIGGRPRPGIWHRRTDGDPADQKVARMFAEPDVTDVMVAGDFVTVGLDRTSDWESRLDGILSLVTDVFSTGEAQAALALSRDEMLQEAGRVHLEVRPSELHLLDPDAPGERERLLEALHADDARVRRMAVAVLSKSGDETIRHGALRLGFEDEARIVRRAATDAAADAAADTGDDGLRDLFEAALHSDDAWIRWKAVRALGDLGLGSSRTAVKALAEDPDFQVRFEVARSLRR